MISKQAASTPWWVSATERIGVPTAFLGAVLYGGYLLLKPIADEHVETVKQQRAILSEVREMVVSDRTESQRRTALLQQLLKEQEVTSREQMRTAGLLERMQERMQKGSGD